MTTSLSIRCVVVDHSIKLLAKSISSGSMALLKILDSICDVRVIVGSARFQYLDQAIFQHLGVEPAEQKILMLKSTVLFRADFDPIARRTLVVGSPWRERLSDG